MTGVGGVPRKGVTVLSDDELILCDAIFNAETSLALVMSEDFGLAFNLGYTHRLDERGLGAVIVQMQQRGVIQEARDDSPLSPYIGLTAMGGSLWEQERRPVWEAYCTVMEDEKGSLEIVAARREVAEAVLVIGQQARLFGPMIGEPEIRTEADGHLVNWKVAPTVTFRVAHVEWPIDTDWALYESRRTWWKSVPELLRSHRVSPRDVLNRPWPPALFGTSGGT